MADQGAPGAASLPPPPQAANAPGQGQYEAQGNGQNNPSHMPPPPLPPVIIPQNNNPIPTAMTSPMSGQPGTVMSPTSAGGMVRRAAPEPNKRALYVGGLDPRVTEEVLRQIFETTGHVQNVKIIPDKNVSSKCSVVMPYSKIYSCVRLVWIILSVQSVAHLRESRSNPELQMSQAPKITPALPGGACATIVRRPVNPMHEISI
jgi:hypothetical protein